MTTFQYSLVLNEAEAIALRAAMKFFNAECNLRVTDNESTPWLSYMTSIASIQKKLEKSAQQTSGNTF